MAALPLLLVVTFLTGRLHVQNTRLSLVFFQESSQYLLTFTLSSQFWSHGKVPIPVERLIRKDDGKADEVISLIVSCEIKVHLTDQPYQFIPGNLFILWKCRLIELLYLLIDVCRCYLFLNQILIILKIKHKFTHYYSYFVLND